VHVTRLRGERGGILVIAAVTLPIFLMICALVVDAGNWFTHKRQLQNRADAGALAAGVEYLSQLANCQTNPTTAGAAIADAAQRYAGDPDPSVTGAKYNQQITNNNDLVVEINRANITDPTDYTDGGNPCQRHATGDSISPNPKGIWTDVKVRESNIGTLFHAFGLNLPSITAQARVQVKQSIGIRHGGLPFVTETGDYVQCVWARFVDVETGATSGILASGQSNPVTLTRDPNDSRHWTADVAGIDITPNRDDIAVEYYMGIATNGNCDFSTDQKGAVPGDAGSPVAIDWINIYNDDTPGANAAPLLHHFTLTPGTCGSTQVGFIYSSSPCTINFSAEVDHGTNPAPSTIIVDIEDPDAPTSPSLSSVVVNGSGPYYTGTITLNPKEVKLNSSFSQDFTQVGRHRLKVRWEQTSGKVGAQNCTNGNPCKGTFLSEQAGNWQQAFYVADRYRTRGRPAAPTRGRSRSTSHPWASIRTTSSRSATRFRRRATAPSQWTAGKGTGLARSQPPSSAAARTRWSSTSGTAPARPRPPSPTAAGTASRPCPATRQRPPRGSTAVSVVPCRTTGSTALALGIPMARVLGT
jgi:hypothetical protein